VARTPDNERRVRDLVAQYNQGRRQHATIEYINRRRRQWGRAPDNNMMYVKGAT
jgi:hypothetical protein